MYARKRCRMRLRGHGGISFCDGEVFCAPAPRQAQHKEFVQAFRCVAWDLNALKVLLSKALQFRLNQSVDAEKNLCANGCWDSGFDAGTKPSFYRFEEAIFSAACLGNLAISHIKTSS
jgi:hypothetical protein